MSHEQYVAMNLRVRQQMLDDLERERKEQRMRLFEGQLQDQIFCWEGEPSQGIPGFNLNASALLRAVAARTVDVSLEIIPIEAEFAEFIAKRRGIEQSRLDWLSSQPEVLSRPLLLVESNVHTNEMLLVDGHHRYRWLFLNQQKQATAWICHGYSWREYIIK